MYVLIYTLHVCIPDGWDECSKNLLSTSSACGVNDVRRLRFLLLAVISLIALLLSMLSLMC